MLVDRGEVFHENEWKRRYFVRDANANECVNILAKKRWLQKNLDSDKMDIRNYQAIKEMVMALRETDVEKSNFHENKAVALLQKELTEMRGGAKNRLQVQMAHFAPGEVSILI